MRWLSAILVLTGVCLYAQPQQRQEIRFGKVSITGYDEVKGARRFRDDRFEVELQSKPGRRTRLESPDQYLVLTCQSLKAVLGTDEQKRLVVLSAEATGQVNFRYDRPQPLSRLNGTAQRATYDGQQRIVILEGDVSMDGEDEFYIMRWRDNERIVVYLEEELQRVEAKSKERNGVPIGTMTIEPKERKP
ncbi:MAG: LptA/OstA family protein [Fimbriimonadales bacterium]|nr:LptA/OstA family protein [Fimbriimonadales bacterium]